MKVNRKLRKAHRVAQEQRVYDALMKVYEKHVLALCLTPKLAWSYRDFNSRLMDAARKFPFVQTNRAADMSMLRRITAQIERDFIAAKNRYDPYWACEEAEKEFEE